MSELRASTVDPFALTSDPAAYVPSPERERALAQMTAALEAGSVPCLEGPTGIGKTLLLQLLAQRLSDRFEALYMPYPMLSTRELCEFALGLLGRSYTGDPEAALTHLVAQGAARGRPLLLLVDDATSLPPETGRGLAALRADARGALHLAFAGIGGRPLHDATSAFGSTLTRVALEEGIPEAGLRDYVTAQLEHAGASARLRRAFDDEVLEELGRVASGNPRRLHLAAQSILRRAEGAPGEEAPGPVELAAPPIEAPRLETPPPPIEAPPPARREEPAPVPPPRVALPAAEVPSPRAAGPPLEAEPLGEYRLVRGQRTEAPAPAAPAPKEPTRRSAPTPAPPSASTRAPARGAASAPTSAPPVHVEPAPPVRPQPPEPPAAQKRMTPVQPPLTPPWDPTPAPAAPRRGASILVVTAVAVASAVLGFLVASRLQRNDGERSPAPAPSAQSALPPAPTAATEPAPAPEVAPAPTPQPEPEPATAKVPIPTPAPAAAPAPAPTPVEMIQISINATPWALVEVDGRELGETPLGGVSLPSGAHRFVARFPDGRVVERSVVVDAAHRTLVFE